ncbi:spondin-1-like [Dendronephthya gigantea]|uniref:spondin-1-like n=1 Tax=Dendronephthya gigantea TaxID=151771 RepID=UPI00106C1DEE|nr:spondin-1-like [Dendronephthya gigantea]
MKRRSVLNTMAEFLLMLFLVKCFQIDQSLADSMKANEIDKNRLRVKREAKPTERMRGSCCVCGVAVYKATFTSKWNKTTHPSDYPENLAHFSTVIGGTHADMHVVWELGSKASAAVKRFTEWGDTKTVLNKLSRKNYLGIIRIGPITRPNKPYTDRFRADKYNHYLSMISKISPSPDWFVGIDRLDLCNASDCSWKDNITVQLRPMDAGTDSGLKFKATNIESNPTQAIYQIKPNVPNHPAASFYNLKQKSVPPMAEFRINLVHAKGRCSRNTDPKAVTDCAVSRWSPWSSCSVQCGRGQRKRERSVITPAKNGGRKCPKISRTRTCRGRNCSAKVDCVVDSWSPWGPCSKTCGRGRRSRNRKVIENARNGGKKCPHLKGRSKCRIKRCPVLDCKVSEWSAWSPCSKKCGKGKRHRTRELIQKATKGGRKCPLLRERQFCNTFECRGRSKLSSISGK